MREGPIQPSVGKTNEVYDLSEQPGPLIVCLEGNNSTSFF